MALDVKLGKSSLRYRNLLRAAIVRSIAPTAPISLLAYESNFICILSYNSRNIAMQTCNSYYTVSLISTLLVLIMLFVMSPDIVKPLFSQQPSSTISNSSWMIGSSLPTARSEIAGAALDGRIYVIGGFDNSGSSRNSVEAYD